MPAVAFYIGTFAVTYFMVAQVAITVALTIYGSSQQRRAARKAAEDAKNAYNASLQDRNITSITSETPFVYVYGRARVGSAVVAMFIAGDKDQFKYLVCVHAAHQCDAVEKVFIAGKDIGPLDVNGDVVGGPYFPIETRASHEFGGILNKEHYYGPTFTLANTPVPGSLIIQKSVGSNPPSFINIPHTLVGRNVTIATSDYVTPRYQYYKNNPRVRVITHLGIPGDPADAALHADLPNAWPLTATLNGFCYSVVRLDLNQPEFQGGLPTIEVLLRGKLVYDPRSTLTVWSQNNALCINDYLISEFCNVPPSDIPVADVITAANVCDEDRGGGMKRYTMNGTVASDEKQSEVLNTMADAMAGTIVSTTWSMSAGKYIAAVASLDQSDIVGELSVNPGTSDSTSFNGIKGQYITAENLYVATDFKPFSNAAYVSADGRELFADVNFRWTNSLQAVWDLARIMTEDSRNAYTIKAEFSLKAWPRRVGDRVTFTSSLFGITSKVFRITDKKYQPAGIIELTMKEDATSIWDYADAVVPDSTPNTNLPNPFLIDPLASLTLVSGTDQLLIQSDGTIISRIHVQWPKATTSAVFTNGIIEIEWELADAIASQMITVTGGNTEVYLSPVEDGSWYSVRARTVDPYLNVRSDWVYAPLHMVVGKSEPPTNVINFSLDGTIAIWDKVNDSDLAGYRFKFNYGNNSDWGAATLLYQGIVTHSPFDLKDSLPFGQVTIMIKAIDTSGNESVNAANIFTNLGNPPIKNSMAAVAIDPTYTGTTTGGSVISGDLQATALDSFYGSDGQSFYGPDADSFYEPSSYAEMVFVTSAFLLPGFVDKSGVFLNITTIGDNVTIEYRSSPP